MRDEPLHGGHNFGDSRFVVGAEQGAAIGRYNCGPHLVLQVGVLRGVEYDALIRQVDQSTVVVAVYDGLHVGTRRFGRGVHVGTPADDRNFSVGRSRQGGVHVAVGIEFGIVQA